MGWSSGSCVPSCHRLGTWVEANTRTRTEYTQVVTVTDDFFWYLHPGKQTYIHMCMFMAMENHHFIWKNSLLYFYDSIWENSLAWLGHFQQLTVHHQRVPSAKFTSTLKITNSWWKLLFQSLPSGNLAIFHSYICYYVFTKRYMTMQLLITSLLHSHNEPLSTTILTIINGHFP